jgi:flagellar FliL protein
MSMATPSPAAAAPSKGGKRRLLLLALVLVLVAVGLVVVKPMLSPGKAAPDLTLQPGAVVTLDPITLNLADGRFLKVGLALQLTQAATREQSAAGGHSTASASTESSFDGAKALDAAISILGKRSYQQLLAPGGRAKAQADLSAEVALRYERAVMRVYFTQFVMQ